MKGRPTKCGTRSTIGTRALDRVFRPVMKSWPTRGFSQSSGSNDEWNIWIVYPALAWAFLTVAGGLIAYLRKPISEGQIKREIERQARS